MRILIPALKQNCPAELALRAEGLNPEVQIITNNKRYSELIHKYWNDHKGFIIVEHDVIPWPGALKALWSCKHEWCGYSYPLHAQGLFGGYLGCTKFSAAFTDKYPKVPTYIWNSNWQTIDGILLTQLRKETGKKYFHLHFPPVAHIRELPMQEDVRHRIPETLPPNKQR